MLTLSKIAEVTKTKSLEELRSLASVYSANTSSFTETASTALQEKWQATKEEKEPEAQARLEQVKQELEQAREAQARLEQVKQELRQTREAQARLEQVKQELRQTREAQARLEQTKRELEQTKQTQARLEQIRQALEQAREELVKTGQKLGQARVKLEPGQAKLEQARQGLEQTKQELEQGQARKTQLRLKKEDLEQKGLEQIILEKAKLEQAKLEEEKRLREIEQKRLEKKRQRRARQAQLRLEEEKRLKEIEQEKLRKERLKQQERIRRLQQEQQKEKEKELEEKRLREATEGQIVPLDDPRYVQTLQRLLILEDEAEPKTAEQICTSCEIDVPRLIKINKEIVRAAKGSRHLEKKHTPKILETLQIAKKLGLEASLVVSTEEKNTGYSAILLEDKSDPENPKQKILFLNNAKENSAFLIHADVNALLAFCEASKNQLRYCESYGLVEPFIFTDKNSMATRLAEYMALENVPFSAQNISDLANPKNFQTPPNNYKTIQLLSTKYPISRLILEQMVKQERQSGNSFVGWFMNTDGKIMAHLDENFLLTRKPYLKAERLDTENWPNAHAIYLKLKEAGVTIHLRKVKEDAPNIANRIIQELLGEAKLRVGPSSPEINEEEFKEQYQRQGQNNKMSDGLDLYYKKELAEKIFLEIVELYKIPEGYDALQNYAQKEDEKLQAMGNPANIDLITIEKNLTDVAEAYASEGEIIIRRNQYGFDQKYYHNNLISRATTELELFFTSKSYSVEQAAEILRKSPSQTLKIVREYKGNPRHIQARYIVGSNVKNEYVIMAELMSILETKYKIPDNMMPLKELARLDRPESPMKPNNITKKIERLAREAGVKIAFIKIGREKYVSKEAARLLGIKVI